MEEGAPLLYHEYRGARDQGASITWEQVGNAHSGPAQPHGGDRAVYVSHLPGILHGSRFENHRPFRRSFGLYVSKKRKAGSLLLMWPTLLFSC